MPRRPDLLIKTNWLRLSATATPELPMSDDIVERLSLDANCYGISIPDAVRERMRTATAELTRLRAELAATHDAYQQAAVDIVAENNALRAELASATEARAAEVVRREEANAYGDAEHAAREKAEREASGNLTWALNADRQVADLTRKLEAAAVALEQVAKHPKSSDAKNGSYAVGWAFGHMQSIAREAHAALTRKDATDGN